ncbi:MAG TPA: TonB-dependent receptor [Ignavibacteria bacterium]|nr:TonB-dependent receptor [Ignavibacteria bacterium]
MKTKILYILLFLFISAGVQAQTLKGKVVLASDEKEVLPDARIQWINTEIFAVSDIEGKFEITTQDIADKRLVIRLSGYFTDTVAITNEKYKIIRLRDYQTGEIVVKDKSDKDLAKEKIEKTEAIDQHDLEKAACCDLSGCFGTSGNIEVSVSDVVTDSKDLKLLGTDGVYTLTLKEGIPLLNGLSSVYGLSSISGTMINAITVAKGSNSVLQGYESISGIINVIMKEPESSDKFFLNAYTNSYLEKHINVNGKQKFDKMISALLAFHSVQKANRIDNNDDGFLDLPLITRYSFYNRWNVGNPEDNEWSGNVAFRYLDEKRIGGQKNFNEDNATSGIYGQTIKTIRNEFTGRLNKRLGSENSIVAQIGWSDHRQRSIFGLTDYNAFQRDLYVNVLFDYFYLEHSNLKVGFNYRHQDLNEDILFSENPYSKTYNGSYKFEESIPGLFAENKFEVIHEKLDLVPGVRVDFNSNYGTILTPRFMFKYGIDEQTVLRGSVGSGFRTPKLFAENQNLFATGKDIIFPQFIKGEKSINWGVSLTREIVIDEIDFDVALDFYRTTFTDQFVADYDEVPGQVIFYNSSESSVSNSFQSEITFNISEEFDGKLSYNYLDVYYFKNGVKNEMPFNAKHRGLFSLTYETPGKMWMFSGSAQYFGKQRLPSTKDNPVQYQRPDYSDAFGMINSQLTFRISNYEIYSGVENILNYKQSNPIISAENPFGQYFDTSFNWGPTKGREFYVGARFKLN